MVKINNEIYNRLKSIEKSLEIVQGVSLKHSLNDQKAIINRLSEDLSTIICGLESILIVVNQVLNNKENPS